MALPLSRCLLLTAVTLSAGCVAQIQYAPRTHLIDELGFDRAASELAAVINRARRPVMAEVQVSPQSVTLMTSGVVVGWWGATHTPYREVFFSNIAYVDIFGNGRTFVYDVNHRRVAHIDFAVVDDGMLFADLMMSFRAWDGGAGGQWPQPEAAPAPGQGQVYEEPAHEPAPDPERGTTRHVLEGE